MTPFPYSPGLHVLATIGAAAGPLRAMAEYRACISAQIAALGLVEVGAAWPPFAATADAPALPGGFTGVVALTEWHLSVHTWPEYGHATFDVFLSNYRRDNADRARQLYAATLDFFAGSPLAYTEVRR